MSHKTLSTALCALSLLVTPTSGLAQADSTATFPRSIGFTDPSDDSNLLDYRLPDWSWYTWDVRFDMGARGARRDGPDEDVWSSELYSRYQRYRESEDHQWDVFVSAFGAARGSSRDFEEPIADGDTTISARFADASLILGGSSLNYLNSLVGVRLGGSVAGEYRERRLDGDMSPVTGSVGRQLDGRITPGFSVGRIRNVDPLLRAERISERLIALGRPPLDSQELRSLAGRIAKEGGYDQVFDRSQKYFWASLLEAFATGESLSSHELLYLLEVFEESYGLRFQGLRLDAEVEVGRSAWSGSGDNDSGYDFARPVISGSWFHNLSLEHQIHIRARWLYSAVRSDSGDQRNNRDATLRLGHLMLVTDRWRWQNQVLGARALSQSTVGGDWRGIWSAGFNSSLVVFIEDRLSLVPTLGIQYRSYDDPAFDDHQSEQWTWNVELALEYQIGQGLY